MDCFRKGHKTEPEENRRSQRRCTPRRPKVNGWSWPPHPFQIVSWIACLYFPIVVVGILIPLLPSRWVPAGYIWFGGTFIWHVAFQVIAATIDPAEDIVRAKGYKRLPPVYKGKPLKSGRHKRYCPLCEVMVCRNSHHCNRCKKCVGNFDHHCKWLNNCVGGRNYRYFLSCVISAVLGCLIIITISGFVFVGFFLNPKLLRSNPKFGFVNDTNTWLVFLPYFSIHTNATTILVLAVVTIGLSVTALIVLCELLFFHFYIMWKQISTYEYILFRREQKVSKVSPQNDHDIEALRWKSNQNTNNAASHQKGNTHVHFESTSTDGSTSEYRQDTVMIEDESFPTVASGCNQDRRKKISQLKEKRRRKMCARRFKRTAAIRTTKRPFRPSQLPPVWKQISTYEYILFRREQKVSKVSPQNDHDIEALRWKSNQNTNNAASHQKGNTHVHFESTSTDGSTSEYRQDTVMIEDESFPTVASGCNQDRRKKISQLKEKRRRKMCARRFKRTAAIRTTKRPFRPSQLPPALAAAIRSSVLSLQSFPSMNYLSALSVSAVRSVRAAGPPAEYRSDSVESE